MRSAVEERVRLVWQKKNVKEEIEFGSYELKVFRINDNMMQEIMITDEIENIGKDDQ